MKTREMDVESGLDRPLGGPAVQDRTVETRRLQAVEMMVGAIAHDVNNLMETILSSARLLRDGLEAGHPDAGMLESIERAAAKAGSLTKEIFAFTKGGQRDVDAVNLNPIVCHVMLVEEQQLAPRVRIVRHVDPDLWDVAADVGQITEMVLELALNAVASVAGDGRVVLTTRNVELDEALGVGGPDLRSGKYVYFSVQDDGDPLESDARAEAFEKGFSVGTGPEEHGLARVYDIVHRHGGHISVNCVEGWGTVFHVYLPALEDGDAKSDYALNDMPGGTETILIIDDDEMVRDVTYETLKRLGYQTLMAEDGKEAVEIARAHPGAIQLALLDLAMPVMGGAEAFPLLKEARPDMKVIICTGFEQGTASKALMDAGVSAFLLKPFGPSTLAQEIRSALDGAATSEAR